MKIKNKKILAIIMAGVLGASLLAGCSEKETEDKKNTVQNEVENEVENDAEVESGSSISEVGKFNTTDLEGNAYTEKLFEDYELTLVNAFTTWCSPCVEELPHLDQLYKEMQAEGVNVVGIVMDTVDGSGNIDKNAVEKAKILKERTKITYPVLIPDSGYLNGRVGNLQGFPETFFVDKNGKIVGETYQGSTDFEEWREIVKTELAKVKGE